MSYHCKHIAMMPNGRRLVIKHTSTHPFMTRLPAVLTRGVYGGRSGRKVYRAGTRCLAMQMPNMSWHVEPEDSIYELTTDGITMLTLDVDFTIITPPAARC